MCALKKKLILPVSIPVVVDAQNAANYLLHKSTRLRLWERVVPLFPEVIVQTHIQLLHNNDFIPEGSLVLKAFFFFSKSNSNNNITN